MNLPKIKIKPKAKHNGAFLTALGLLCLATLMIITQFYWQVAKLPLMFLIFVSMIIITIGIAKLLEPASSYTLTPKQLKHHHKYGHWSLNWPDIVMINQVKTTYGIAQQALPYIGLKLTEIDKLADNISPRLANRLIHEQKILLVHAIQRELINLEQSQINFTPYELTNGRIIKGPVAAFLHQAKILQQALGYHLYLPENSTDRSIDDFIQLLKQCRSSAENYPNK